jgi:hypothetical protein
MNGKQKGSAFEREVCKKLSLWVSHGKSVDLFWRSAMSGGRATVARTRGRVVRQAGDITAVAPEGHALTDLTYIECKFYRDLDIESFLIHEKGKLAGFWRSTKINAKVNVKAPWLIAKQNRLPTLLITARNNHTIRSMARNYPSLLTTHLDGEPCDFWIFDNVLTLRWSPP